MKATKFLFYALIFTMVLGISCSREDVPVNQGADPQSNVATKQYKLVLTGEKPEANSTKTHIGDNGTDVVWNPAEEATIFYLNKNYKFVSTNTTVKSGNIEFEGIITSAAVEEGEPAKVENIYAVYPYDKKATIDNSGIITTTLPAYQVATAGSFANNLNISMAYGSITSTESDIKKGDLYFYNVCSGLCFSVSNTGIKYVEIESKGEEYLAGTFKTTFQTVGGVSVPVANTTNSQIVNGSKIVTVTAPNNGEFIPGELYYIVTLPTTCSGGFYVTAFTADGKGYEFDYNNSVTFNRAKFRRKLTIDAGLPLTDIYDYFLGATAPGNFAYSSGTRDYTVTSYKVRKSDPSRKTPTGWKVQALKDGAWYDLNEDNKESLGVGWLTFAPNGNLNSTIDPETFSVSAQTNDVVSNRYDAVSYHTDILRANSGTSIYGIDNSIKDNAIDLSLYDADGNLIPTGRNTANCYVVRAPGWYKFPAVYGNGIKDGVYNVDSYKTTGAGDVDKSTRLYDAENTDMDARSGEVWISKRWNRIQNPSVLWQDAQNLVTNVELSGTVGTTEEKYIYFKVDESTIRQGNAVIGVNYWSRIAWSWHIWVTDELLTNTIEVVNANSLRFDFMPFNLGWCSDGEIIVYDPRVATVRIVQVAEIATTPIVFNIRQEGGTVDVKGSNTVYQWGRKDPMLPPAADGNGDKQYWGTWGVSDPTVLMQYNNSGTWTTPTKARQRIASYILNPTKFNTFQDSKWAEAAGKEIWGSFMENKYANLWNMHANKRYISETNVKYWRHVDKTMYDPCPYGFTVAPPAAFSGMNSATDHLGGLETQLVEGHDCGFYFYRNPNDKTAGAIFFPMSGIRRQSDGTAQAHNEDGYYWTSDGLYSNEGISVQFGGANSLGLDPNDNYDDGSFYMRIKGNYKGTGYAIRPVKVNTYTNS